MKDISADDLWAIDIARINLAETVRRGRQKQAEYEAKGDTGGVEWMQQYVARMDKVCDLLGKLLRRLNESEANNV